jgi:phospho-N-acetylmuramoyl-pentapeptide-transferase
MTEFDPVTLSAFKVFLPTVFAFITGLILAPFISSWLYSNSMWKKKSVHLTLDGKEATITKMIHNDEEKKTPRMGGLVILISVGITIFFFWFIQFLFGSDFAIKIDFLSRNQTWLPLFTFFLGGLVGFIDDFMTVSEKFDHKAGGLSLYKRLFAVFVLASAGSWWFYEKLDMSSIHIPFNGDLDLGIWFIPFFIIAMIGTYSGGVIDGIDGLSGGIFSSIFSAFGVIAFAQNQIDLAAFCFVIVGGILAFLWFNIPPARFYMSETGTTSLTVTLTVIAFLTGQILLLPIIALPLVLAPLSNIVQLLSKKFRGKKIFLVAPIHHHFEALGWPSYRVTMRFWVFSIICAIFGMCIALLG